MTHEFLQPPRARTRGRALFGLAVAIATGAILTGVLVATDANLGAVEVALILLVSIFAGASAAKGSARGRLD